MDNILTLSSSLLIEYLVSDNIIPNNWLDQIIKLRKQIVNLVKESQEGRNLLIECKMI